MNTKYYSTNGQAAGITFREALLKGLAPDGGLFMPCNIPAFTRKDLESLSSLAYHEIAALILKKFTVNEIGNTDLEKMCREAYNFEIPLERLHGRKYIMRLDRGPTASFKDFAARLMSRLMGHFLTEENRKVTILTATSGDTGSAVASAFHDVENIDVIILFPLEEVTSLQRKQMTTLGHNVSVIGVRGKFDHCQDMVKKAFTDESLKSIPLTSANSINIGRLLPQSVYYAYAWSRLRESTTDKIIFSVPSGNFGNLTAGLFASRMGIPVSRFVISTNANDEVPEFLRTGVYKPVIPSRNCISSAMNVGHPSNLPRIAALYGGIMNEKGHIIKSPDLEKMKNDMSGISVSDDETRLTLSETYRTYGKIVEPHGAVALNGLNNYMQEFGSEDIAVVLETAHPYKFAEEIEKTLGLTPPVPSSLAGLAVKIEKYDVIENDYSSLKKIILQKA